MAVSNNKAAIFLATGYEMTEAIATIDILRRAEITVDIISISDQFLVKSSHNVEIKAEKLINNINFSDYRILILPGGSVGVENLDQNQLLKNKLVAFAEDQNKLIAAICAAPQILGKLKLLENKKVTFYPGCDQGLDQAVKTDLPVVVSSNIITGKSVGCVFQFALQIVTSLLEKEKSLQVAEALKA